MKLIAPLSGLLFLSTASAISANDFTFDLDAFSFEAGFSTQGLYLAPRYELTSKTSLRAPFYYANYDDVLEADEGDIDGEFSSLSGGLVIDYTPFDATTWSKGFMVSGGIAIGGYEFAGSSNSLTFDGVTYTAPFDVTIKQKSAIAPVFSTGYRYDSGEGFTAGIELGVKIASLEITTTGQDTALTGTDLTDYEAELAEANDDLSDVPVLPFLNLAFGWSF